MASLKSFLPTLSNIFGHTPDALYSRQRALVGLGVLGAIEGRGPGSGVPLTAENVAALVISLLAANTLSDVDENVVNLCRAIPSAHDRVRYRELRERNHTFAGDVGRAITDGDDWCMPLRYPRTIRVSRPWRGQILGGMSALSAMNYYSEGYGKPTDPPVGPISHTTEIEEDAFQQLQAAVRVGVSISKNDGDDR